MEPYFLSEIESKIQNILNNTSILCRYFGRIKSPESIREKIKSKKYKENGKKLTDIIGIRIIVYFPDDIEIIASELIKYFEIVNCEIDKPEHDSFGPIRHNYVFIHPTLSREHLRVYFDDCFEQIDSTFEIQLRTILSEGWHEIEHDLRYKHKNDWEGHPELSRTLNGIFATLNTSEWTMLKIFDEMAYKNYKKSSHESMLRHKLRMRIKQSTLSNELSVYLTNNRDISKKIIRLNRQKFILWIIENAKSIPKTIDNIIYLLNEFELKDGQIEKHYPEIFKIVLNK